MNQYAWKIVVMAILVQAIVATWMWKNVTPNDHPLAPEAIAKI
jgi:hypothetical protein